jgi:periplasmic divalent cation tolerance protein
VQRVAGPACDPDAQGGIESYTMVISMIVNVITTLDQREKLEEIGRALLEKRLVSCVQVVGPIRSTYWWKGRIEEAEEWIGIMKTREDLYEEVERQIRALHPYELPQIEAVKADYVLTDYARWVKAETTSGDRDTEKAGS